MQGSSWPSSKSYRSSPFDNPLPVQYSGGMQLPQSRCRFFAAFSLAPLSLRFLAVTSFAEQPLPQVERLKTSPVLQHLKPNPLSVAPRTPAEQTVAQMYLPEGFRAELIVAEPDLHQPVAFAFDERGRIWV